MASRADAASTVTQDDNVCSACQRGQRTRSQRSGAKLRSGSEIPGASPRRLPFVLALRDGFVRSFRHLSAAPRNFRRARFLGEAGGFFPIFHEANRERSHFALKYGSTAEIPLSSSGSMELRSHSFWVDKSGTQFSGNVELPFPPSTGKTRLTARNTSIVSRLAGRQIAAHSFGSPPAVLTTHLSIVEQQTNTIRPLPPLPP